MSKQLLCQSHIRFPSEYEYIEEIVKCFRCFEEFENAFGLEFSCGEGIFLSDMLEDEELTEKYEHLDGEVCLKTPARFTESRELLKPNKWYTFAFYEITDRRGHTIRYDYYLNSKKTGKYEIYE